MKLGLLRDWLRPILGAALLLGGAAAVVYKVIGGYQRASPDAFFSVQDQNKRTAASAADSPTQAATAPVDVPAPPQPAATAAQTAPIPPAQTAPIPAAPPATQGNSFGSASSAAGAADLISEAQDSPECAAIKSEQHEIRGALNKQYSPEEGRYMQRRLRELAEQLVKLKCAE